MPIEILMPALSPTMEEGTLAKWLVKESDTVSSGDIIAEIETDKATMEFEAVDEGTIGKIVVPEGSEGVKVNALIAVLLQDGEEASDAVLSSAPADDAGDKAAATAVSAESATPTAAPSTAPAPAAPAASDGTRIFASPLARRIAADTGLDLSALKGSGPHGRIVKADVLAAGDAPAKPAPAAGPQSAPQHRHLRPRFPRMPLRKSMQTVNSRNPTGWHAQNNCRTSDRSKTNHPAFLSAPGYQNRQFAELPRALNKQLEARGVKLSVNDFIIKACALACKLCLRQTPFGRVIVFCNSPHLMWPLPSRLRGVVYPSS